MSEKLTREQLVERVAEISHATYLLQAVRDQNKRLDEIDPPVIPKFEDTPDRRANLDRAERMLEAVRAEGASLAEFSDRPGHVPTPHDRERADNTVTELERLGLWRSDR